jgi:hypothetical protein
VDGVVLRSTKGIGNFRNLFDGERLRLCGDEVRFKQAEQPERDAEVVALVLDMQDEIAHQLDEATDVAQLLKGPPVCAFGQQFSEK